MLRLFYERFFGDFLEALNEMKPQNGNLFEGEARVLSF